MTNNLKQRLGRIAIAAAACGLLATPSVARINAQGVFEGMEKVSNSQFEKFDIFSIRLEEFGTGMDGHYQAVLTIRNDSDKKANLTASSFDLNMVSAGNEPRRNEGSLYEGSAAGPITALIRHKDTIWLEPRDQARVRVAWPRSAGFAPTKLRLRETQWNEGMVVFAIGN